MGKIAKARALANPILLEQKDPYPAFTLKSYVRKDGCQLQGKGKFGWHSQSHRRRGIYAEKEKKMALGRKFLYK